MIPVGEWMTYDDLAGAAKVLVPDSTTSTRGVVSALSFLPPEADFHD